MSGLRDPGVREERRALHVAGTVEVLLGAHSHSCATDSHDAVRFPTDTNAHQLPSNFERSRDIPSLTRFLLQELGGKGTETGGGGRRHSGAMDDRGRPT